MITTDRYGISGILLKVALSTDEHVKPRIFTGYID